MKIIIKILICLIYIPYIALAAETNSPLQEKDGAAAQVVENNDSVNSDPDQEEQVITESEKKNILGLTKQDGPDEKLAPLAPATGDKKTVEKTTAEEVANKDSLFEKLKDLIPRIKSRMASIENESTDPFPDRVDRAIDAKQNVLMEENDEASYYISFAPVVDKTRAKQKEVVKNEKHVTTLSILNKELELAIKERNYNKIVLLKKKIKGITLDKRFNIDYKKKKGDDVFPQDIVNRAGNKHLPTNNDINYYRNYIYDALALGNITNLTNLMSFIKNADFSDYNGNNLVMKAAMYNNLQTLKYLVQNLGIAHNVANNYEALPIHVAAYNGNYEMVKFLLDHNTDIILKDQAGNSAVDYAKLAGHGEILDMFAEISPGGS